MYYVTDTQKAEVALGTMFSFTVNLCKGTQGKRCEVSGTTGVSWRVVRTFTCIESNHKDAARSAKRNFAIRDASKFKYAVYRTDANKNTVGFSQEVFYHMDLIDE